MTLRIEKNKWILYRHLRDFNRLVEIARLLKSFSRTAINKNDKERLNQHLREVGLYNERNENLPLDSINHNINQLSYYMFGYQSKLDGQSKFMFSPLGNLYLKYASQPQKATKIFLTMLWGMQYQHPHGGTDKEFQLYPFRLIYKLLQEPRLDYKLYAFEVAYSVVFIKENTLESYEELVDGLLSLRKLDDSTLSQLFQADRHTYVNAAYEWDYYVSEFLRSAGVLEKTKRETICRLQHGNTSTFRKITRNFVRIPETLLTFSLKLQDKYSFLDKPLPLNDEERLKIDIIKEIYSFYPDLLLMEIGEKDEISSKYLNLPRQIEQYANNPNNETAYLFEEVLTDGFNLFCNVEAHRLGGAGHTDIECLYLTKRKKFAVESKSTANKLLGINAGRLREQREEIGGEYTIVVTPRYVPAAKRDIQGTSIVIILASTLAEYLYNSISNDLREIDYADFDTIITRNLGKDVSNEISNMTLSKFATTKL